MVKHYPTTSYNTSPRTITYEKFHLKFLKWNLSVHSKASNAGCWGESGRYPLFFEASKLAVDYFERVQDSFSNSDGTLLAAAFSVQKELGLDWYTNLSKLCKTFTSNPVTSLTHTPRKSIVVSQSLKNMFVNHWKTSINTSPKLELYRQVKSDFLAEPYLSQITTLAHRASVTRMRISAHNLYIERGRYARPPIPRESRWCVYCFFHKKEKIVEDEAHALLNCPLYQNLKTRFFGSMSSAPTKIENYVLSSTY